MDNTEKEDKKAAVAVGLEGAEASKQSTSAAPAAKKRAVQRKSPAVAQHIAMERPKLFGKYPYDVTISDQSLKNYINLTPFEYPNTFRGNSNEDFSKAKINIVERLENYLMRGGTGKKIGSHVIRTKGKLQGKKIKVMHIVENAFDKVYGITHENPLQVLIRALENSAPIEDTTRVRYGGVVANVTVDISASKRLDIALRNIAFATVIGAFDKRKNIVDALADELILAANNDINSYAIKRKNEIERMARSAR
ncbi:MAG: 30S ribosomal protein S7 [Candidatus Micrarchaeaceae archaeon]